MLTHAHSHDAWEPEKALSQVCQEPPKALSCLWQVLSRAHSCLSWGSPKALPRVVEEHEQESVLVRELVPVAARSQLLGHRSS